MKIQIPNGQSTVFNFNYQWHFKIANAFPLKDALEKQKDSNGHFFYEKAYTEESWEEVGLPHTYNDKDLFVARIEDAGSGQLRTFSFYRKWFQIPKEHNGKKVIIEFEGIRQSCFLYLNGKMVGFHENGVAPFAFDLTTYIDYDRDNLIAIATDNTSTRNTDFCMAETPNKADVEAGSYLAQLSKDTVPEDIQGVGYFWNCNDFNPSIGGITKNVRLHIKPMTYLTLPIYSNLETKGVYIYGKDYNISNKSAIIHMDAEVRNESGKSQVVTIETIIVNHKGEEIGRIQSDSTTIEAITLPTPPLTITPEDAYRKEGNRYVPVEEDKVSPTKTDSLLVSNITASSTINNLRFWSIDDPYLYEVYTNLCIDGEIVDSITTVTGFRKVEYDSKKGLLINEEPVWLTGYAQRSSNEWAAIGIAPDWLKDVDAKLVRESNANHIRWMHVAASPADIRSCDRYGVVCTQPAGDKERENFGRQWDQRMELMRDIIIYFRNSPSILFWEAGNNAIGKEHMREMRLLKQELDPDGGRYMGCRTLSTQDVVEEAEYVGTMLNRHAGRFQSEQMPITETEYLREESPRRVWDDFSPPHYDYDNLWLGRGGRKQIGGDCHDLNAEEFALVAAKAYSEFFHDRMGGASQKNLYSATAALCWTDSAQHGRQAASENARMSGRVDPVRIKKQSFEVFRTIQSIEPAILVLGHWSYPQEDGSTYKYYKKEFNGLHWIKTKEFDYRDPKNKTVYVIGNYPIQRIDLYINDTLVGTSSEPMDTFIYSFHNIDITQSGYILANGYDFDGKLVATHRLDTAIEPASIRLTPYTGDKGLLADGADIAYFDVEVLDKNGNLCPLSYDRIDFTLEGEATFLGGYNSGKYNGYGKEDSVIHKPYVYAECGINRVFIRASKQAGSITLKAKMKDLAETIITLKSESVQCAPLYEEMPHRLSYQYVDAIAESPKLRSIPAADASKYKKEENTYCKVLLNGHEVDTHGIKNIYENNSIWGPVLLILDKLKSSLPDAFDYSFDKEKGILIVQSSTYTLEAEVGKTHMLVNGEENLLNGQPIINKDNVFWMEINVIVSYIEGIHAEYDENINVYRLEIK